MSMLPDLPIRRKPSKRNNVNRLPPTECSICYRPADGYHCGVPSCKACKTFFRRMCVSKAEVNCRHSQDCFDATRKPNVYIRCQACRFKKCTEVGMNPLSLELDENEKNTQNFEVAIERQNKILALRSKEYLSRNIIQSLVYLESKLDAFRMSAYNPVYFEMRPLVDVLKSGSKLSMADKYGRMPGWPLTPQLCSSDHISNLSQMRDVPDNMPGYDKHKKIWLLFSAFTTIEYAKTFAFFHQLKQKDQMVLTGHVTLMCTYLHMSYFAMSRKVDECLQPDGTESPKKDEAHYAFTRSSHAPLIRCNIKHEEYVLLKAICLCNPTVHDLSEHAQKIISKEQQKFAGILFDYCLATPNAGPSRFVELLGIIPVLAQQQQLQKSFFVYRLVPILMKYDKIAQYFYDIMFL